MLLNKSGLDQILKGTAKFKETQNKLEQSYSSLLGSSFCAPDMKKKAMEGTMHSFMSIFDENEVSMDELEGMGGHSLSREEL